jgi:hypothetical protein
MKHIKKFEGFSMQKDNCERCYEPTNGVTAMGVFNQDVICSDCKEAEKDDPDYELARNTELEEVRKGNYNYPGIYPNYKPIF